MKLLDGRRLAAAAMIACAIAGAQETAAPEKTYSERLGWGPNDRVVIFHVDDVGMSDWSNDGAIRSIEEGVATSLSIMMPCPWVPEFNQYLKENPQVDAGLHLTLTSEWDNYRWGPLAGKPQVPGLVDKEGCLWGSVAQVVAHAKPEEVEIEIRAQIDRARTMGFEITHLDTHMGTVYATPLFLQRYIKVGIEEQIPVMVPGGHAQFLMEDMKVPLAMVQSLGKQVWEGGLPVLDDLHNVSYGWKREEKVDKFIADLKRMKPGLTQFIVHSTDVGCNFKRISGSSETRQGDLEAMIDPRLKKAIEEEGIILTTWREAHQRRKQVQEQESAAKN